MTAVELGAGAVSVPAAAAPGRRRHLWSPTADFLLLGGGSLLLLPLVLLLPRELEPRLAGLMMLTAHALNHPHFAHSYQIFYSDFANKVAGRGYGPVLRARYILAGIAAPALLLAFFAVALTREDPRLLGYGGNVMAFMVGWHYVKQGYGMLMVDAALKQRFFTGGEKKLLLWNAYSVWIAAWMVVNQRVRETDLWGLKSYALDVPQPVVALSLLAAAGFGAATIWTLARKRRALPWNGVAAYLVSLYAWLLFVRINPLWMLVTPALHSLQYLAVVWRYQSNVERARERADEPAPIPGAAQAGIKRRHLGMADFATRGALMGFLGFWGLPMILTVYLPYDRAVFGETLFLFVCWAFINVHHYLLDNVMWRRENPQMRKHLFG